MLLQLFTSAGSRASAARRAPGPAELPLVGSAFSVKRDPLGFLGACRARHGRLFRFHLGPLPIHIVGDPDWIRVVLQEREEHFVKSWGYDKVRPVLGNGLLTSDGELWKRQRRLILPTFHHQKVAGFAATMVEETEALVGEWAPRIDRGQPIDVAAEMMTLALRIVGRTLFGTASISGSVASDIQKDAAGIYRAMTVLVEGANRRILSLGGGLFDRLPTRENRAFEEARRYLDRLVFDLIAARRRQGGTRDDLLAMLLEARDEHGEPMPDAQVRDELITLLLAGHETTANAMAWTFLLLGRHPEAFGRLREELSTVLGPRAPTGADVPRLAYSAMVTQEAMRLYPPGWILARTAAVDEDLAGYQVPAGSIVAVCPYLVHRDPAYWDSPERFDPLRFTKEAISRRSKFAYLPFSAGPRACIGRGFAMMEMTLILATIAQRLRLEPVASHPIALAPEVTLRPKHGVLVRAHRL